MTVIRGLKAINQQLDKADAEDWADYNAWVCAKRFDPGKERFETAWVRYPDGECGYDLWHVLADGSVAWHTNMIEHSKDLMAEMYFYCEDNGLSAEELSREAIE